jgi:hypothetical protein
VAFAKTRAVLVLVTIADKATTIRDSLPLGARRLRALRLHIRTIERRNDLRFPSEPVADLQMVSEQCREDFDCDDPIQAGIAGFVVDPETLACRRGVSDF